MTTFWILIILVSGTWHILPDTNQGKTAPLHFDSVQACEDASKEGEQYLAENNSKMDDHRCIEVTKE